MPIDAWGACDWMLGKLLQDVANAKMLALKINHLKHQDQLRDLS